MKYPFRLIGFLCAVFTIAFVAALYGAFRFVLYPAWTLRRYTVVAGDGDMWQDLSRNWWVEAWQKLRGTYVDPEEILYSDEVLDEVARRIAKRQRPPRPN
jgi:hypothetical protein